MPEGAEVRRFAHQLDRALAHQTIVELTALTKVAKKLQKNGRLKVVRFYCWLWCFNLTSFTSV